MGREWSTQVGMEAAATTGQSTGQWVVSHSALMAGLESPGSLPWEDTHHELSLAILWAGVPVCKKKEKEFSKTKPTSVILYSQAILKKA